MGVKIVVIADLHAGDARLNGHIRGDIADLLLARAALWCNTSIHPDITILLGDIADDGKSEEGKAWYPRIRKALGRVQGQTMIIPGNHDCDTQEFYKVFERPGEWVDVKGVRIVPFIDEDITLWNSRRSQSDIGRMKRARAGFDGEIVCVQHVPILPRGASECPYNAVNAEEIIGVMKQERMLLTIGGHYHLGVDLVEQDGIYFGAADAICRGEFGFWEVNIEGKEVTVTKRKLMLPRELELIDLHNHTPLGYCGSHMDIVRAVPFAKDCGLTALGFSEHTDQLLLCHDKFEVGYCHLHGLAEFPPEESRVGQYYELFERMQLGRENLGFELECNFDGEVLLAREDAERASYLIGSVHGLEEMQYGGGDVKKAHQELLRRTECVLKYGADVLAHPFRCAIESGLDEPVEIYDDMIGLLKKYGAAAEINCHRHQSAWEFFKKCIEAGVKISLGSDSHREWQVGLLWPHLEVLEKCGVGAGDLKRVLVDPRRKRRQ
jgi:histidinol phosphatase-like PHP family hydrolase/calcineurin-like phosphoesterase family protein